MSLVATRKSDQNQAFVDPWTVVHFGVGLAAGLTEAPPWLALSTAVLYEVFEHYAEKSELGQQLFKTSGPESLGNAVVDVGVYWLGMRLGRAYNRR